MRQGTMKLIIVLACVTCARADLYIDGVRHHQQLLVTNVTLSWLYSLAVDYTYNTLYFIDNGRPAVLDLNTGEYKYLEGMSDDGLCVTVDQATHDVYIGTEAGIYRYKPSSGESELVGAEGVIIRQVYFKEQLYYIEYYSGRVFTLNDEQSHIIDTMRYDVDGIAIDNEGVMFFSNTTQLYSRHNDSRAATLFYDDIYVFSIALDIHDKVYFSADFKLYEVLKHEGTYRSVTPIDQLRGITFDKDNNFIYCDVNNIYMLTPLADDNYINVVGV